MSNMSYCRFENTVRDLNDCQAALEDLLIGEIKPLSETELDKAKELLRTCVEIVTLMEETLDMTSEDFVEKMNDDPAKVIADFLDNAQRCAGEQE